MEKRSLSLENMYLNLRKRSEEENKMDMMDFFKERVRDFFMITTFVNVCMFVLGMAFNPDGQFSYEILIMPLVYGFVATIPSWIRYSKKELSVKSLLIRKVITFLLIEASMIAIESFDEVFSFDNISLVLSFAFSVFVVYLLVEAISYFIDHKSAKEMMEDLQYYQNHYSE